ncbi:hypothetical protein HMPREF3190_01760 [Umbribacter vaginalis]|nr:hypothetical protein HMPREF3190_01760 [Coriobacteriales bacterium DNF00809]
MSVPCSKQNVKRQNKPQEAYCFLVVFCLTWTFLIYINRALLYNGKELRFIVMLCTLSNMSCYRFSLQNDR